MAIWLPQMGGGGKKIAESTATTVTDVPASNAISAKGIAKGSYDEKSKILLPYADVASAIGLTADKIVSGNTILGVDGSAKGKKIKQFSISKGYTFVSTSFKAYLASFVSENNKASNIGNTANETGTYYFIVNNNTAYFNGLYGKSEIVNIPVDGTEITIKVGSYFVITTTLHKSFFETVLSEKGYTKVGVYISFDDGSLIRTEYFCLDVIDGYIKEIGIFSKTSQCYADYTITIEYWG